MKKNAGVHTNDRNRPRMNLVISGPVEKFVTIYPRHVNLRGYVGDSIISSVTLIPEKKYPFKILNVRARNGKYISYQLEEIKKSDNTAYEIKVQNLKQETGRFYDTIILETDSKIRPQLDVKVYGYLWPRKNE